MIVVLGGGFGLYGHVAALAGMGRPVATLARYRAEAEARPELAPLVEKVTWLADEGRACAAAGLVCLARRPADNARLAEQLAASGKTHLIVEKPIAPTAQAAMALTERLADEGCRFAVPYLFLHCDWFQPLAEAVARGDAIAIQWTHPGPGTENWKGDARAGGGPLGFYLIHALALIEALLPGAAVRARATGGAEVALEAGADGRLAIDFARTGGALFRIAANGAPLFAASGPFGDTPARGRADPRLPALRRFYETAGPDLANAPPPAFHSAVHAHWRRLAGLYEGRDGPGA